MAVLLSKEEYVLNIRGSSKFQFKLEVIENSTSIESNTSNVTINFYGRHTYSGQGYSQVSSPTAKIYIGGQEQASAGVSSILGNSYILIANITTDVQHNDNGTKTISVSANFSPNSTYQYCPRAITLSGDVTLTTIARATNCPTFAVDVERSINISLSPFSNNFTHSIKLQFGNNTSWLNTDGNLSTDEVRLSNFTPLFNCPSAYYSQFSNNSKTGTITLNTYSGDTLIGSKTNNFTIYANAQICVPFIEATLKDINETTLALTNNENIIVSGQSTGLINFITKRASSINDQNSHLEILSVNGINIDVNLESATILNLNNSTITIFVQNSRGSQYNGTFYATASDGLLPYVALTLDAFYDRVTPTGGGVYCTLSGNYFNSNFSENISNALYLQIWYREKGTEDWQTIEVGDITINNNTWSYKATFTEEFNYQKQYEFRTIVNDKLMVLDNIKPVSQGIPIWWYNEDKFVIEKDLVVKGKIVN